MLALVLATSNRLDIGDLSQLVSATAHGFATAYTERRWSLALGLANLRVEYAVDVDDVEGGRVEQWLARSGADGPEAIRGEVVDWDTSELDPVYDVARDLLLGAHGDALGKLNRLRASGDVSDEMIAVSVVFDPIRSQL
jgi:hypothetical protein